MAAHETYTKSITALENMDADHGVTIIAMELLNTTGAKAYLQMFGRPAASVTLGTTLPQLSFGLPADGGMTLSFPTAFNFPGGALSIAGTTDHHNATTARIDVNIIYGG